MSIAPYADPSGLYLQNQGNRDYFNAPSMHRPNPYRPTTMPQQPMGPPRLGQGGFRPGMGLGAPQGNPYMPAYPTPFATPGQRPAPNIVPTAQMLSPWFFNQLRAWGGYRPGQFPQQQVQPGGGYNPPSVGGFRNGRWMNY